MIANRSVILATDRKAVAPDRPWLARIILPRDEHEIDFRRRCCDRYLRPKVAGPLEEGVGCVTNYVFAVRQGGRELHLRSGRGDADKAERNRQTHRTGD